MHTSHIPIIQQASFNLQPSLLKPMALSYAQILELLQGQDDEWLFSRAQLATELEFKQQV